MSHHTTRFQHPAGRLRRWRPLVVAVEAARQCATPAFTEHPPRSFRDPAARSGPARRTIFSPQISETSGRDSMWRGLGVRMMSARRIDGSSVSMRPSNGLPPATAAVPALNHPPRTQFDGLAAKRCGDVETQRDRQAPRCPRIARSASFGRSDRPGRRRDRSPAHRFAGGRGPGRCSAGRSARRPCRPSTAPRPIASSVFEPQANALPADRRCRAQSTCFGRDTRIGTRR